MGNKMTVLLAALLVAALAAVPTQATSTPDEPSAQETVDFVMDALPDQDGKEPAPSPSAKPEASPGPAPPPTKTSAPEPPSEGASGPSALAMAAVADAQTRAQAAQERAQEIADWVQAQVPTDPVGLVTKEVVNPVQRTAGDALAAAPALLEPTVADGNRESSPQTTASVAPSASLLAGTLIVAGATAAGAAVVFFWMAGSSGTAGAAGATAAKAATKEMRRLLPFASPLFTRFERNTVLGHPKREALYGLIMQTPGISLQALGDATGLSRTAVNHHLRLLELQHLIVSKRMGRSRHYYENGGRYQINQKEAYALLQNDRSRQIANYIQNHPGTIQRDLCQALGLQASIAHWHVKRLSDAQLIEPMRRGRTVSYFPGQGMQAVAVQSPMVPITAVTA